MAGSAGSSSVKGSGVADTVKARCARKTGWHLSRPLSCRRPAWQVSPPTIPHRASRVGAVTQKPFGLAKSFGKRQLAGFCWSSTAAAALIWANSPASEGYFALRDFRFGYEPWHLELSLGAWAADGLLAIFFFLVGLELKKEFVAGDLRSFNRLCRLRPLSAGLLCLPWSMSP